MELETQLEMAEDRGSMQLFCQVDPTLYPEELDMDQLRTRLETDPNGVAGQMRGHVAWRLCAWNRG